MAKVALGSAHTSFAVPSVLVGADVDGKPNFQPMPGAAS